MKILGIGVDIEDISRFKSKPYEVNTKFYETIFTKKEIQNCLEKKYPYQHFAARFCAKEAFIKASNEKLVDYTSIEIENIGKKPVIKRGNYEIFLSISHEKDKAIAFVIILSKER